MMASLQCRAVVCRGPNLPLSIEQVLIDPPKSGEVRIKIVATGVCHSDAHLVTGHITASGGISFKYPSLIGHEGAGIVESIGDGVTNVGVGDHVLVIFMPKCNSCDACLRADDTNLCSRRTDAVTMEDGTTRTRTLEGEELYNFVGLGTLAEYLVCSETRVAKIPNDIPLEKVSFQNRYSLRIKPFHSFA